MKKLAKIIIAGSIILTSGITAGEASAKSSKSKPNYYNSAVVKKVKAGTYVFDGFKLGGRLETYLNNSKYEEAEDGQAKLYNSEWDLAIADRYDETDNPRITRIFDNRIEDKSKYEMNKMKKIYGKPLYTVRNGTEYAHVYKNVIFTYEKDYGNRYAYLTTVTFYKMNNHDFKLFRSYIKSYFNKPTYFSYALDSYNFNDLAED
ncbi:hypothetical protein AB4G91_08025 [Macrococcoides goetzii]|uniref:hypothetical protein n=1 Tax=Macrococcus TaxID=69965 RepID=UPI001EF2D0BB|nr:MULTISPECIES: hypothetical protein [Macrococcus]MCG7421215.1 hypothetical protein [Macrococcus epidermidis]MCH4984455.1 hypothetical protein [Macrococcus sp. PK]MCH4985144.1 hypothetical protein [Macrococcus sp. PK]